MENKPDIFKTVEKNEEKKTYIEIYNEFMDSFQLKGVSPEEVGWMIAKMTQHYVRQNLVTVRTMKVYSKLKSEIQNQTDAVSGKGISVAKADTLASATPESYSYEETRAHCQNILECVNSLKALQRGIIVEYSQSSL